MDWRVTFETPAGHPSPLVVVVNEADWVMGFMSMVVANGWSVTLVETIYDENVERGTFTP